MSSSQRSPESRDASRDLWVLGLVCLVSTGLRLWILDVRWINPDEGAHLMDAALALEGQVPQVDFVSRQPLYVYFLAASLKLLGSGYAAGRLALLACSVLTGVSLYLLARLLFNPTVGLLAASLFWLLPLEILTSTNVKTEPLAMLLATTSLLGAVAAWRSGRAAFMVGAGVVAAMGFYVRESTLVAPAVVLLFVALRQGARLGPCFRDLLPFGAGYLGLVALVLCFYSQFLGMWELLSGSLSPLGFIADAIAPAATASDSGSGAAFSPGYGESYALYLSYVEDALALHLFLIFGAVLCLGSALIGAFRSPNQEQLRNHLARNSVALAWLGLLALIYGVQFTLRGFFIDYFRELLPPLALCLAVWLATTFPGLTQNGRARRVVLFGMLLGGCGFLLQGLDPNFYGVGHHASLAIAATGLAMYWNAPAPGIRIWGLRIACGLLLILTVALRQFPGFASLGGPVFSVLNLGLAFGLPLAVLGRRYAPGPLATARYAALAGLVALTVLSLSESVFRLSRSYETVWSQEAVASVASYLREHTSPEAEILSGATIWELEAGRHPFAGISHPLAYKRNVSDEWRQRILRTFEETPPEAVVLDGYTEQVYLRNVPELEVLLDQRYERVLEAGPAHGTVHVLALRSRTAERSALP